jgi:nitrogen fixation/metabolism regulation signal transduction histidine kinase
MAKQVAHEIKNPLTPMRLTVQSFQTKILDANDPELKPRNQSSIILKNFNQQIDTMSSSGLVFSNFV